MRPILPLVLIGAMLQGCGSHPPRTCTLIGGQDALTLITDAALQTRLVTIVVQLDQGKTHRRLTFHARSAAAHAVPVVRGVTAQRSGQYVISLGTRPPGVPSALAGPWSAGKQAALTVEGLRAGLVTYRHQETFRFSHAYPNGRGCDPDLLMHTTSFGKKDKLSKPVHPGYSVNFQPVEAHIGAIASRHPGFVDLVVVAKERSMTVIWSGRAPDELRVYAASRPQNITVKIRENARFSKAQLEAGRDRLFRSGLARRLDIVTTSVPASGRALILGTMRKSFTPSTLALLRRTAQVDVEVQYGLPATELF